MMAFVSAPFTTLGIKTFTGTAITRRNRAQTASLRMAEESETSSSEVGVAGKSLWKENYFTGGFPGGEQFYKAWTEDGMTKDVPDLPPSMQPSVAFKSKDKPKQGLLARLDATEFFSKFAKKESAVLDAEEEIPEPVPTPDTDIPDPQLYEQYYPLDRLYKAPDIKIVYEKDFVKDRVYMAMTEVTAAVGDLYFPKETQGKAPMITLSYNGSLQSAYVKVALEEVEGLPTLPPPPRLGEASVALAPGNGGGLKLEYSVAGTGPIKL